MNSLEAKGKTVDEAIFNGLNKLGVGIDEVEIDIIHEGSKGLFGFGRNAVVRLTIKENEPVIAAAGEPEEFLNGLFEMMKIDASCTATPGADNTVAIEITGKDTAVLIGRRGDTLDALQYLTGLVINRGKSDYCKVMLDAENYRQKREVTLEKLARRLASNVAKSGKPVTLEPMNPYERRILHATLQSNPRVETHSEGEEPYRRVVIRRKRRDRGNRQGGGGGRQQHWQDRGDRSERGDRGARGERSSRNDQGAKREQAEQAQPEQAEQQEQ